jgi:hypothetical protein
MNKETAVLKLAVSLFLLVVAPGAAISDAADAKPDQWAQVRFMIGTWHATVQGEPGTGTVVRTYEFVLNDQFIHEHNISTYPPQEKNKQGEVHQHLGFISYDRKRKTLVLRQFHQESFVNTYVLSPIASKPGVLVFESETFENFDSLWKAKETYAIISNDEFVETFELAPPGKPFETYSRNHFKRVK